jgi:hypothetical protein
MKAMSALFVARETNSSRVPSLDQMGVTSAAGSKVNRVDEKQQVSHRIDRVRGVDISEQRALGRIEGRDDERTILCSRGDAVEEVSSVRQKPWPGMAAFALGERRGRLGRAARGRHFQERSAASR